MPMRKDPMTALKRRSVDDAPQSRHDALSLGGVGLLPGGIFATVKIRATSDQTGIVNTVETQVTFDTTDFDTCADDAGGHADFSQADLSNNRLICRQTGVYGLLAGARWVPATVAGDPKPVIYQLKRNGTVIALVTHHWINSAVLGTGSEVGVKVALEAGDTITFHVIQFTGLDKALDAVFSEPFLAMTWEAMFSGTA